MYNYIELFFLLLMNSRGFGVHNVKLETFYLKPFDIIILLLCYGWISAFSSFRNNKFILLIHGIGYGFSPHDMTF